MPTITYLLCFADTPVSHARHYVGKTTNLPQRVQSHRKGRGNPLCRAALKNGAALTLGNLWGSDVERLIKRQKNAPRWCAICNKSIRIGQRPGGQR